jgi:hypothetical protein
MNSPLFPKIILFWAVANAIVILSAGEDSNRRNGFSMFRRAGSDLRNSSLNKIAPGGQVRQRKDLRKQHVRERMEPQTIPTKSNTEDLSDDEYTPNIFLKEEEEIKFIKEVLNENFMFQDLCMESQQLSDIVTSFEKYSYDEGDYLYKQGETENTDYMYLIARGSCSVAIDGKVLPLPYGKIGPGSLIGDLALLYGTPRAATVRAKAAVRVYRLHKTDFNHFMHKAAADSDDCSATDKNAPSPSTSTAEKMKEEMSKIDRVIDRISGVKTRYDGDVIQQFKPSRKWLWSRWNGTIMQHVWKTALGNMSISLFFMIALRLCSDLTWPIGKEGCAPL